MFFLQNKNKIVTLSGKSSFIPRENKAGFRRGSHKLRTLYLTSYLGEKWAELHKVKEVLPQSRSYQASVSPFSLQVV